MSSCAFISSKYALSLRADSSAWLPTSTTEPRAMTTIWSADCTVDRRCAMTSTVRPATSRASAPCTAASDTLSSAEVASSRMMTGLSLSSARAMAMRWRWPPDSRAPRSPTMVL
mmetsp:Transcript_2387/g.6022  ORF Transcript_2387/g.6022 Transcript_2387/m.6022 type:complete len:114 (-) Transcript_2387:1869-2210(-)